MRVDALLEDPACIRALRLALARDRKVRSACPLTPLGSWGGLEVRLQEGRCDVALVQPSFGGQSSSVEDGLVMMDRLRFLAPGVCLVPYLCGQDRAATNLRRLGEWGFSFFLIKDFDDDPGSILRLLASCSTHRGVLEALDGKNHGLTREQARLVSELLEVWPPAESVEALAKEMNVAQRTLRRTLAATGLRPPRGLTGRPIRDVMGSVSSRELVPDFLSDVRSAS